MVLNAELPAGGVANPLRQRNRYVARRQRRNVDYEVGGLASITGTTIFGENEFTYYCLHMDVLLNPFSERVEFTVDVQGVDGLQELPTVDTPRLVKTVDAMGREWRSQKIGGVPHVLKQPRGEGVRGRPPLSQPTLRNWPGLMPFWP